MKILLMALVVAGMVGAVIPAQSAAQYVTTDEDDPCACGERVMPPQPCTSFYTTQGTYTCNNDHSGSGTMCESNAYANSNSTNCTWTD